MRVAETRACTRARLVTHLALAEQLARTLVPSAAQRSEMEQATGLHIDAVHRPLDDLGGDLWVMRRLAAGRLLLVLADAVGHGLSGAINAFRVDAVLRGVRRASPSRLVAELDERLSRIDHGRLTAGVGALTYDPEHGHVQLCCAGLPPALLFRGGRVRALGSRGMPVGSGMVAPRLSRMVLRPGDQLVLASDGFRGGDPAAMLAVAREAAGAGAVTASGLAGCAGPAADDLTLINITRRVS